MSRLTVANLRKLKQSGEPIASLTAYDASFARLFEQAGVEILLVGDSLGMVVQGHDSTLPVTMDALVYHCRCVRRGSERALLLADLPFASYGTREQAFANAARLMQEGGAHMVKLEGGAVMVDTVRYLAERGIPVCAHLGLLPQSVNKIGGYQVQGRGEEAARAIIDAARAMEQAGADAVLLECVPRSLARAVTEALGVPTIGIGAGPECDGQVLVAYDMLALTPGKRPRFSKDFLAEGGSIAAAAAAYVRAVKERRFPGPEHSYE